MSIKKTVITLYRVIFYWVHHAIYTVADRNR